MRVRHIAGKLVPRLLTEEKDNCVAICLEFLDRANEDESFLKTIITGDETWAYAYVAETKV